MSYRSSPAIASQRVRLSVAAPWFASGTAVLAMVLATLTVVGDRASAPSFAICGVAAASLSLLGWIAWFAERRRVKRALMALNGDAVLDETPADERSPIDRDALVRWGIAIGAVLLWLAANVALRLLVGDP